MELNVDATTMKLFESVEKLWQYLGSVSESVYQCDLDQVTLPTGSKNDALIALDERYFDAKSTTFLPKRFANLQTLLIFEYPLALKLVSHFEHLTKLCLYKIPQDTFKSLCRDINGLKSLKVLYLTFPLDNDDLIPSKMPILAQLEDFLLGNYWRNMAPVLNQLGPNIRKLSLFYNINAPITNLVNELPSNAVLNTNLTHLKLYLNQEKRTKSTYLQLIKAVTSNFSSLVYLEMPFYDVSILIILAKLTDHYLQLSVPQISTELAPLKNLSELVIDLRFDIMLSVGQPVDSKSIQVLKSVKTLYINDIFAMLPCIHFYSYFPIIFPNVETINHCGFLCLYEKQLKKKKLFKNFRKLNHYPDYFDQKSHSGKYCDGLDQFMLHMGSNIFEYL